MSSAKHTELDDSLTPREEEVLSAIVRDRTVEQIAKDMGYHSQSSIYTILDRIRVKLGAKTIHGAAAIHAHRLGLTGELLHPGVTRGQPRFFRCGKLAYPATVITRLSSLDQVTCVVEAQPYRAPTEFHHRLGSLRQATIEKAAQQGTIAYERAPDDLLVVNRLIPDDEFYVPLKITLRRTGYLTWRSIRENLTDSLREKYSIDPNHVLESDLPYPMGVSLHIIAGEDPHIVVLRRANNMGIMGGFYSSTVQGYGEATKDLAVIGGQTHYIPARTFERELEEERAIRVNRFRNALRVLGLLFSYRQLGYGFEGMIRLKDIAPEVLCHRLSAAKEGTYEMMPMPRGAEDIKRLEEVCAHLKREPWQEGSGIGLVMLLQAICGVARVEACLGR